MSVLTLCTDGSVAVSESITSSIAYAFRNKRPEITPPMIANARRKKILRIRQQLAQGTYGLDERLDAVLERILMDISP